MKEATDNNSELTSYLCSSFDLGNRPHSCVKPRGRGGSMCKYISFGGRLHPLDGTLTMMIKDTVTCHSEVQARVLLKPDHIKYNHWTYLKYNMLLNQAYLSPMQQKSQ